MLSDAQTGIHICNKELTAFYVKSICSCDNHDYKENIKYFLKKNVLYTNYVSK